MRSYRRYPGRRRGGDNSFWLSFSDLMSSLVLIIILVMFYIIYQYFNMVEINEAEIARREYQLDQAQAELETQQGALTDAEKKLVSQQILLDGKQKELDDAEAVPESQRTELNEAQAQLDALSVQLDDQQKELTEAQTLLASQQEELSGAQAELETKQGELASAQAQLASQQAVLENQQDQIEQLVGMRTRIITSLSEALRGSSISAKVDSTTGSITLESDVLFATGEYRLTERGREFIDRFLPVYLNVLFSEEYRPYVSEIIIEGHTDSVGGYLSNLELSQQRALAVASYVLGDSQALDADARNQLRQVVTVNGRSYSDRVFDANGVENMDASRRVVFKFRLTDEQMIQQLRTILEGVDEVADEAENETADEAADGDANETTDEAAAEAGDD